VGVENFCGGETMLIEVLRDALARGKLIAAACIAPTILAKAGILKNREATVISYPRAIEEIKMGGALYRDEPVVISNNIITGRDLKAIDKFSQAIVEKLQTLAKKQ